MSDLIQKSEKIITLLNNINDLIIISEDRHGAKDVMVATVIYLKNNDFPMSYDLKEKIDQFFAVLLDARRQTLSSIVKDIAKEIHQTAIASDRKAKKSLKYSV